MNKLKIKFTATSKIRPVVFVDGTPLKMKKNKFDSLEGEITTDKSQVEISICNYLEINSKLWFLSSLFFFFISLFGIFDIRYDKLCAVSSCKFILKLTGDDNVNFSFRRFADKSKAVELDTDTKFEELENVWNVDTRAKKRLKIMRITKILLWIALIVSILLIIFFK